MIRGRSTLIGRALLAVAAVVLLLGSSTGCSYLKWRREKKELLKELSRVLDAATAKGAS